jgi:succinyl-CoA synthetase beta subunit
VVAEGILTALMRVPPQVRIVVRLDGTNAEQGRRILADADDPRITTAATMLEAAAKAVEFANAGATSAPGPGPGPGPGSGAGSGGEA